MKKIIAFAFLIAGPLPWNTVQAQEISTPQTTQQPLATGTLTIDTTGSITVTAAPAVLVSGTSAIVNSGIIEGTVGPVSSNHGRGIDLETKNVTLTITNNSNSSIISNGDDAIHIDKGSDSVSLTNSGTIQATEDSFGNTGQAIDFNGVSSGSNTLTNTSTGLIQATGADAVRMGVNGVLHNDGTIKSINTTDNNTGNDGIDAQTNSGLTIVNAFTLNGSNVGTGTIEGARHGITGGNTSGTGVFAMTITNNAGGTIQGDDGSGINIDGINGNELVTITNHGTITGNGVTADGDGVDVDGLVNLTNTGTIKSIQAFNDTSEGVTVGGGTITNSGTIEGDNTNGGVGRGITLAGVDKDTNDNPIPIQTIYGNTTVDNQANGLIKGQTDSAITVLGLSGPTTFTVTITNEAGGTLEGAGTNAVIEAANTMNNDTINEAGTIKADGSEKAIELGGGTNTLNITGGVASITGDISGGTGTSSMIIDPGSGNTFSYGGVISNFTGGMNTKSGTVILTGANTFTGDSTISGGTFEAGNATALGMGNVFNNGGMLETDGVNRTINVNGHYDQESGALAFSVNNSGSDTMAITGAGSSTFKGNLDVDFSNYSGTQLGHAKTTQVFTLVSTVNGYTQTLTFDPTNVATGNSVTIDFATIPDDILLDVTTQAGVFNLSGLTGNQAAVGNYINNALTSGKTNPLLLALGNVVTANPGALGALLDQTSPLRFSNFTSSTAFNNTSFSTQQFDNYLAGHRGADGTFVSSNGGLDYSGLTYNDPNTANGLQTIHSRLLAWNPAPNTGLISDVVNPIIDGVDMKDTKMVSTTSEPANLWNAFISGDVVLGQGFSDANSGVAHSDSTTGAVQIGADYRIDSHFIIGALFGYGHTDATLDTLNSTASVDTYSPGVYASYADGGWYANALGSYGFSDYDQDRHVAIGALNGTAHSDPTGDQIVGNLDGGYDFHRGPWTFGPTLGLQYVHLDVNGFTETGLPGADLSVNENQSDSLRSRLGGHVDYAIRDGVLTFTPHLTASWQHEFLDQSRGITSQFDGLGAGSFAVNTSNPSRDSALVDVGLDAQIDQTWTVFTDYTVQAGQDNYFGQSVQAGVKIGF